MARFHVVILLAFGVACARPDDGLCGGAPVVTWANFGHGFVTGQCMGCHSSTTPDRFGAPEAVTLDGVDDVWAHRDEILASSTGDDPSMPPGSPASEDDRRLLEVWLTCAEEGT